MYIPTEYANCYLDYNRLTRVTEVEPAYRLSIKNSLANRYPIENRKHTHKIFIPETLNNETVYRIYYGFSYQKIEQFEVPAVNEEKQWTYDTTRNIYFKYKRVPNEVGIVYPDNSFEFTSYDGLGQGLRQMFSGGWFKNDVWVSTEVNRGGAVVYTGEWETKIKDGLHRREWTVNNWHPIFRGLRINLRDNTVHHSCKYEVKTYKTIRSASKILFDKYREGFESAKLIISNMGKDNFLEEIKEALNIGSHNIEDTYNDVVNDNFSNNIDMMLSLCIAYEHRYQGALTHVARSNERGWWYNNLNVDRILNRVIEVFKEDLIFINKSIAMEEVSHKVGIRYPSTKWGVTVICNNEVVSQYSC